MGRLSDSNWQFITTTIISLVSLLFTILSFQGNDSLRLVGIVVVIVLVIGIVVINLLPASKAAGQSLGPNVDPARSRNTQPTYNQHGNIAPPPPVYNTPVQSPYQYPAYSQGPIYAPPPPGVSVAASPRSRLSPTRRWLLISGVIGFIAYFIAVGIINGGASAVSLLPIGNVLLVIGDVLLFGTWIVALVDTARLGYWGRFALSLVLLWFGIFIYIFFVPTVPRKTLTQQYNQPYSQQYGRR